MISLVKANFDSQTSTVSYVVQAPGGQACSIIDSVLYFDHASGRTDTRSVDQIIEHVIVNGLRIEWILESNVYADHLSAAPYLQEKLGGELELARIL